MPSKSRPRKSKPKSKTGRRSAKSRVGKPGTAKRNPKGNKSAPRTLRTTRPPAATEAVEATESTQTIAEEADRLVKLRIDFSDPNVKLDDIFLRVTALIFANENPADTKFIIDEVTNSGDDRFARFVPFAPQLATLVKQLPARIGIVTAAFERGSFLKPVTDDTITKLRKTIIDAVKPKPA